MGFPEPPKFLGDSFLSGVGSGGAPWPWLGCSGSRLGRKPLAGGAACTQAKPKASRLCLRAVHGSRETARGLSTKQKLCIWRNFPEKKKEKACMWLDMCAFKPCSVPLTFNKSPCS